MPGSGSTTAGLVFGGYTTTPQAVTENQVANTETWNGSSWTEVEVNDLNTAREALAASGTTEANLGFGGYEPAVSAKTESQVANTETWNGTSWTEVNEVNTARNNFGMFGISTSAIAFAGNDGSNKLNNVESFWETQNLK